MGRRRCLLAKADDIRRAEEERAREVRRTSWAAAMDRAKAMAINAHRSAVLADEVRRWRLATDIEAYCTALEQAPDAGTDATAEWIGWARSHVEAINPLTSQPAMSEAPELGPEQLKPFLGSWSPYGLRDQRDWFRR